MAAGRVFINVDATPLPNELLPFYCAGIYFFISIYITRSTHTRTAYAFALFHVFLGIKKKKRWVYVVRVRDNSPPWIIISDSRYDLYIYIYVIDHLRNDPRSMEVLVERSKPSFLLPKKRGQIHFKKKKKKKTQKKKERKEGKEGRERKESLITRARAWRRTRKWHKK